jgi:hypothetical protein
MIHPHRHQPLTPAPPTPSDDELRTAIALTARTGRGKHTQKLAPTVSPFPRNRNCRIGSFKLRALARYTDKAVASLIYPKYHRRLVRLEQGDGLAIPRS